MSTFSAGSPDPIVDRLCSSNTALGSRTRMQIARDVLKDHSVKDAQWNLHVRFPEDLFANDLATIAKHYKEQRLIYRAESLLVKGGVKASEIVVGRLMGGGSSGGSSRSTFSNVMGTSAKWIGEEYGDHLIEKRQELINEDLSRALTLFRQTTGQPPSSLGTDAEHVFKTLNSPDVYRFIFTDPFSSMDPTHSDTLRKEQIRTLGQLIAKNQLDSLVRDKVTEKEIRDTRLNLKGLDQTFQTFKSSVGQQLQSVEVGLTDVKNTLAKQGESLGFLQEVMFWRMPSSQQLEALRRGYGPKLPEDKELELEHQLDVTVKWESFQTNVSSVLDSAATVVGIAKNLKVDPKIVSFLEKGIALQRTVSSAIVAFGTGNILGGVMAATSLFTNADDPQAKEHEQVMQGIQEILKGIRDLAEMIESEHREVMEKLDQIHEEIVYNRNAILRGTAWKDLNQCEIFLTKGSEYKRDERGIYPSLKALTDHCHAALDNYGTGRMAMESLFVHKQPSINELLWMRTHGRDPKSEEYQYENRTLKPILKFLIEKCFPKQPQDIEDLLANLLVPSPAIPDLKFKMEAKVSPAPLHRDCIQKPLSALISPLLDAVFVRESVGYVLDFLPYYDWIRNPKTGDMHTTEEILSGSIPRDFRLQLIRRAKQVVETAMAQQALLAGDALLPLLEKRLIENPATAELEEVLTYNPVLAANLLRYCLYDRVKDNLLGYAFSLGQALPELIQRVTGLQLPFEKIAPQQEPGEKEPRPKIWHLMAGKLALPLPAAVELRNGELRPTQGLAHLMPAYSELLDVLVEESFSDKHFATLLTLTQAGSSARNGGQTLDSLMVP